MGTGSEIARAVLSFLSFFVFAIEGNDGIFINGFLLLELQNSREEATSEFERVHWREAV